MIKEKVCHYLPDDIGAKRYNEKSDERRHRVEKSEFLTDNNKIAKTFNSLFKTVTHSLNLFSWSSKVNVSADKDQGIILNISNHPSIL